MKKIKRTPFFIKFKNAIFNFDKYQGFAQEKVSSSIKYFLKLVLIFSIITLVVMAIKIKQTTNKMIEEFNNEFPNFSFQDNCLVIEGDNKEFKKDEINGLVSIILNSEKEELNEIEKTGSLAEIALLKNKLVLRNSQGAETNITYESINQKYDISNLTKESIVNFIKGNSFTKMYIGILLISFTFLYIQYLVSIIIDILLLSIIGWIVSRIINVRFKYKVIFNLSVYSMTLSITLYVLYIIVNTLTGFTIKYFGLAYNAISYIYIITAMLMIRADLIKQQMELAKIVDTQEIEKEKNNQKDNEEKNKNEDEKKDKDDEEKKEHKKDDKINDKNSCGQE